MKIAYLNGVLQIAVASVLAAVPIYQNHPHWAVATAVFGAIAALAAFAAAERDGAPGLVGGVAATLAWTIGGLLSGDIETTMWTWVIALSIGMAALSGTACRTGLFIKRPTPAVAWLVAAGVLAGLAVAPQLQLGAETARADLERHMASGKASLALSGHREAADQDLSAFKIARHLHDPKVAEVFGDPSAIPLYTTDYAVFWARKEAIAACAKSSDRRTCAEGSQTIRLSEEPVGPAPVKAELIGRLLRIAYGPDRRRP